MHADDPNRQCLSGSNSCVGGMRARAITHDQVSSLEASQPFFGGDCRREYGRSGLSYKPRHYTVKLISIAPGIRDASGVTRRGMRGEDCECSRQ